MFTDNDKVKSMLNLKEVDAELITDAIAEAESLLKRKLPADILEDSAEENELTRAETYFACYFLLPRLGLSEGDKGLTKTIGWIGENATNLLSENDIRARQEYYYRQGNSIICEYIPMMIDI